MGRVCDYLLIYLYTGYQQLMQNNEVNKSINWVHQFKTESSWSKCNWFYLIVSDMARHPLENVALRTFYETRVHFPLILGIWRYKAI